MKRFIGLVLFIFTSSILPLKAQEFPGLQSNDAPIEISAEDFLEWHQKKKQYIAKGSVVVTQEDMTIEADELIADYVDDGNGDNIDIVQVTATGNVILKNTDSEASADKAIYDVKSGLITLTGNDLKLTTPEQTITATERLEYNVIDGTAKAVGKAKIVGQGEQLEANMITAKFGDNATTNQKEIKTAKASGNVKITTNEETITGNQGTYNVSAQKARMSGNVVITRGANQLEGDEAEIDLAANISRITASQRSDKRVKGIFFPQSNGSL